MKRLLVTATAIGLAFGGSALAQSTTTQGQGASDLWSMDLACSDFVAASEAEQREIIASYDSHKQSMGDGGSESAATGSAGETESNKAISSGADVSMGTRGTDQSGTAALTAEGEEGDPTGTTYQEVSLSDVVEACESSPDSQVSEVVDEQQTQ